MTDKNEGIIEGEFGVPVKSTWAKQIYWLSKR